MDGPKNHARAVRYRQLALAEPDKDKAPPCSIRSPTSRSEMCSAPWIGCTRNLRRQPNRSRGDANFSRWSERSSCACWRMVVIVASVNATPNAKMRTAKTNRRPICGLRTRSAHRDNAPLERWFQWTVGRPRLSCRGFCLRCVTPAFLLARNEPDTSALVRQDRLIVQLWPAWPRPLDSS